MSSAPVSVKSGYLPGIDGLRALAVLSVIVFHFNSSLLPGGFSGVDVFFVISGYVVSASLAKEHQTKFWPYLFRFYARRILRIYPALVLCLLLIGFAQTLFVPSSWLSTTSNKTAISAFFGLSNFALIWFSDGYFSPRVEFNAFTHTWSLAVEEQFYLLFPMVFFVWLKGKDRKDAVGVAANWLLAVLLVCSLLISWRQTGADPDQAYYLLPSRFWELASGAMLFKLHNRGLYLARSSLLQGGYILTGLILISAGFTFSNPASFPFPWALLSVFGSLFVISGVASHAEKESIVSRTLDNPLIVYIGKISYSLYLWHWSILVIFRWTVGLENPLAVITAIALIVLASIFSFHFIERPVRQSKFATSSADWRIISRGIAAIGVAVAVAAGVFNMQPYLSLSVTKDKRNWYPEAWSLPRDKSKAPQPSFQGRKLYVLGDSHTGAYSTMLQMLGDDYGVSIHKASKGGCSVVNLLKKSSPECAEFITKTIQQIKAEAAPGDIVFLASLRMNRLSDQWATFDAAEVDRKQDGNEAVLERAVALHEADLAIQSLEAASLRVMIDAPKPVFRSPPFRCADWFNKNNPVCVAGTSISRNFLLTHRAPVMASIQSLQHAHPKLIVWDTFPVLCPATTCAAYDQDQPLFFDGDHLSAHGNRVLYPSFLAMIKTVW